MSQAFYSAMSGMNAAQARVNVVADNIANMNTVGFKQSRVDFSDIYYNTMSGGSAASSNMGGTNPRQVGTGVRIAGIARDFTGGSAVTTGISTHLSIKGNGFFTVASPSNEILYTRAGNFSIDGEGHLVLPNGYKALGTANSLTSSGSRTPIKVPPLIQTQTSPTGNDKISNTPLGELNGNINISDGDFDIVVGGVNHTISVAKGDSLQSVVDKINALNTGTAANPQNGVRAEIADGKLSVSAVAVNEDPADPTSPMVTPTLEFEDGSSNFVKQTGLTKNDAGVFDSKVLDYQQSVRTGTDTTNSHKATNVDIYEDGRMEVTYANGDKLSITTDPNDPNNVVFQYKTGNPAVTLTGDDLDIRGVAEPANFQLQMASFVNPNGLVGVGSNAFREGPNSGLALFGGVSTGAFGAVNSGEYEGSNVDLAEQFADMVQSQRMIEANSRVFDTASQVIKTLSYLGQ